VSPTGRIALRRHVPRLAVDARGAIGLCGMLLRYLSLSSLFPTVIAVGYHEPPWPFLGAGAIAAATGLALERLGRGATRIGFREGYFVVAVTWLLAAAYGALPYLLSGDAQLSRPMDAAFEAMSGFTTTGASVLTDIDSVDRSLLMWRQFTQWLGGMGIVVLALAILPRLRVGGRQLLESELPGPEVEPLADRIRATARKLWILYVGLTALQAAILTLLGIVGADRRMGWFEAVSAAFATLPTGGFMPDGRSWEDFAAVSQWVAVVFMVVAGANFALTYRALTRRKPGLALRDEEFRLYIALLVGAAAILAVQLSAEGLEDGEAAIRHGAFQAASIMTTTGFASVDFSAWPTLAAMLILLLMFVGGSAGSTGGSIKVVRHLLLGKALRRELRQTVHAEIVLPVRFNSAVVDERTLRAITSFVLLYLGIFVAGAAVIAIDTAIQGPSVQTLDVLAAAATTLGNVGPGFGVSNPMGSFESFSDVSTLTMIGLMWLGRLEVVPIVVLATRHYWRV
jgi:trk system potassium uptake protein TrkH